MMSGTNEECQRWAGSSQGRREGGSRVMNLALGGWWRLCHRVQLKHLEQPVHRLHLVHHLTVYHLTVYCKCTLCLLALLSQLCVLLYILRIKQRYIVQCCVAPHSSVSNLYRNCLDNLANKYSTTLPKIEQKVLWRFTLKNVALLCIVNYGLKIRYQV